MQTLANSNVTITWKETAYSLPLRCQQLDLWVVMAFIHLISIQNLKRFIQIHSITKYFFLCRIRFLMLKITVIASYLSFITVDYDYKSRFIKIQKWGSKIKIGSKQNAALALALLLIQGYNFFCRRSRVRADLQYSAAAALLTV